MAQYFLKSIVLASFFVLLPCSFGLNSSVDYNEYCMFNKLTNPSFNFSYMLLNCSLSNEEVNIRDVFAQIKLDSNTPSNIDGLSWTIPLKDGILHRNAFSMLNVKVVLTFSPGRFEKIHKNAFDSSSIRVLFITGVNNLTNEQGTEYDLYEAISKLEDLISLRIALGTNSKHKIPENAIKIKDSKLEYLKFISDPEIPGSMFEISEIGNNMIFNVSESLVQLSFIRVKISSITKSAFKLKPCSECSNSTLTIQLIQNEVNNTILQPGVFDFGLRKVRLDIGSNPLKIIRQEIFEQFLNNNRENEISLENSIECKYEKAENIQWLLNEKDDYRERVRATCENGISIWDFDWNAPTPEIIMCNSSNEYNISWPAVESGQYSVVDCRQGKGKRRWLCGKNGTFDPDGPSKEECWLDQMLDEPIETVDNVVDIQNQLDENMNNTNSIHSMANLVKVLLIVERLDNFLKNNSVNVSIAVNITQNFVTVFSHTIGQTKAWKNGSRDERQSTASNILSFIQRTAFTMKSYVSAEKTTKTFVSNNLYENLYFNSTQSMTFEYNSNSITVPDLVHFQNTTQDDIQGGQATLIRNLHDYLTSGIGENQLINSELIAFSIEDTNQSHTLTEGYFVKIREGLLLGDEMVCKYWDFIERKWSSNGCELVITESNRNTTVCLCNHLTNFAALMDVSGRETNNPTKKILTYVFSSISVVFLILTIFVIIFRRKLSNLLGPNELVDEICKKRRTLYNDIDRTFLHLSICLLIVNFLVIFALDRTKKEDTTNTV